MKPHPTTRFTGLADTYARCRPSYPSDAIDFIIALAGLGETSLIVDVGCGTGISSRIFAERGLEVLGVEPNDDMRRKADQALRSEDALRADSALPTKNVLPSGGGAPGPVVPLRLRYTAGTAEATNLASASADLVISAQAFHWFDQEKALIEFHRILKVNAFVALMWNERDERNEFTQRYGDIFRSARDTAGVEGPRMKAGNALLESTLFEKTQRDLFSSSQILDEDGLIGRAFSASYAPKENPERERFEKSLRQLFREFAASPEPGAPPVVTVHYATSVYTGQRLERA